MNDAPPTSASPAEPKPARWLDIARDGSAEALGGALEACRTYLLLVANRELDPKLLAKGGASDLVQETFLDAQRDFATFRGHTDEEWRAWLRQTLLHNLANFTRRYRDTDKREVARETPIDAERSSGGGAAELAADMPSPSAEMILGERLHEVDAALSRLPDDYRRVIMWRYQEGRAFSEIAEAFGRSENAVRKLWFRAIERLQQELENAS
jgi:RNA polymerase sigma-70 factor (ECF subfamily)